MGKSSHEKGLPWRIGWKQHNQTFCVYKKQKPIKTKWKVDQSKEMGYENLLYSVFRRKGIADSGYFTQRKTPLLFM